jgi:hypothetical protein
VADWTAQAEAALARYADGESRLPAIEDADARQRQSTRMGNAAAAAGLCLLMTGRRDEAAAWLRRAAACYRESYAGAPPGSWGRPLGAMKARLLAGDERGAEEDARWALDEGAAGSESPIGRYAGALALLVLGRDAEARPVIGSLRERDDFPHAVADALATIAAEDPPGYRDAIEDVLESFETREEHLEGVAVADTVLVLQALATRRSMGLELESALLPAR